MRIFNLTFSFFCSVTFSFSQNASIEIKTIDEVIQGIDDLLSGVDAANESKKYTDSTKTARIRHCQGTPADNRVHQRHDRRRH